MTWLIAAYLFFATDAEEQNTDIDQILLAVAVMITATVIAGSVARRLKTNVDLERAQLIQSTLTTPSSQESKSDDK